MNKSMKKSMKRRQWVTLVIAVMFVFATLLAACSKGKNADSSSKPPEATTQAPQSSAPQSTASSEPTVNKAPVKLKLLTWFVGQYQKEFDLFHQKYPWLTIEPVLVGGNDANLMEKQAALQAAGDSADLTWLYDLSGWTKDGLLEDLTPYIAKDPVIQNAKIAEGHLAAFKTGDKTYAVPFSKIAEWILINKDLMKKKGMEMPANDWTYDNFLQMAKKATDPAAGEYGIAYDGLFQQHFKWPISIANGHADNLYWLNADLTQSVADTPGVLDDFRWIQELTTKWHVVPTAEEAKKIGWDTNNAFLSGKALFTLGADWVLPGLKDQAKFDWDVLPLPKGTVKQATTQLLGPIAVLAASKHKEEAFMWIRFQFELEAQKFMISNGSNTFVDDPALKSYVDEVDMWKGKNTEAVKMSMTMCCNMPGANVPDFSEYLNTVDIPISGMLTKNVDLSTIKPAVQAWNKKTLDLRKQLGW